MVATTVTAVATSNGSCHQPVTVVNHAGELNRMPWTTETSSLWSIGYYHVKGNAVSSVQQLENSVLSMDHGDSSGGILLLL